MTLSNASHIANIVMALANVALAVVGSFAAFAYFREKKRQQIRRNRFKSQLLNLGNGLLIRSRLLNRNLPERSAAAREFASLDSIKQCLLSSEKRLNSLIDDAHELYIDTTPHLQAALFYVENALASIEMNMKDERTREDREFERFLSLANSSIRNAVHKIPGIDAEASEGRTSLQLFATAIELAKENLEALQK